MGIQDDFGRRSVTTRLQGRAEVPEGPPAAGGEATGTPASGKYALEASLGSGGMGVVMVVLDRDLRRQVAMKMLRPELAAFAEHRLRFLTEAQATSQLEHPGIPPVHDLGLTTKGAPYFTMKLVRGRTLHQVLADLGGDRTEAAPEWNLHRLVTVLERICEAVHFAHEKGVLHRDLKPENVMLGDFGEVYVMDWGIARVRGEEEGAQGRVATAAGGTGQGTLDGSLKGTIPYMSPEQASGRISTMDRRSDVYALGCVLYEILTLRPAFDGVGALHRVLRGEYAPVRERSPGRAVPEDLALLCDRAMSRAPGDRPATAGELAGALRVWLDGSAEKERNRREAEALVAGGREALADLDRIQEALQGAQRAELEEASRHRPWHTLEVKRPMFAARERVQRLREDSEEARDEAIRRFEGALLKEPGNAEARSALAGYWRDRLARSEAVGDREGAAEGLRRLRRYDDGRNAAVLKGDGSLFLDAEPGEVDVVLHRCEDRTGILEPGPARPLGRTPLGPVELPMGSYLCVLRMPGFEDVTYPVSITRNRLWTGHVRMRTGEEIGEGFLHVPGGPFLFGEGRESRSLDLPDFAIGAFPVTFGEYAEFLASVEREKGRDAASEHLPRTADDGPLLRRGEDGAWAPVPGIGAGPRGPRPGGEPGGEPLARIPVVAVSWHDARAYCEWKARTTGRAWRLPTEEEREKAARGVDGRRFPWGDLEDPCLARCRDSRADPCRPEPVGSFPTAASVYGMGDAAGNVLEWTDSWFADRRSLRVVRGGAWNAPAADLRCSLRTAMETTERRTTLGFRCARDLQGSGLAARPGSP